MQEQTFMILKAATPLQQTTPYIIVAGGFYNHSIYGEGHLLVVAPGRQPDLFHIEPTHFPKDVGFELHSILRAQFEFSKEKLARWLLAQIGARAFVQVRQMQWEEVRDISDIVLLLNSNKKMSEIFDDIVQATNCSELAEFVSQARELAKTTATAI